MDVKIVCGKNLLGMDMSGKSDPYVEVYQGSDLVHKTGKKKNTLNPEWNEQFQAGEGGVLTFRVIDRDFPRDDFMGQAQLDLAEIASNRSEEFTLHLAPGGDEKLARKAEKKQKSLGLIIVRVSTHGGSSDPAEDDSAVKCFIETVSNTSRKSSKSYSLETDISEPTGIVHMVLVQARGIIPSHPGDSVNAFCKISLGSKKKKTKIVSESLNPKWREGVDLPWFKGQDDFIEIFIHDHKDGGEKSDQVGRAFLNLRELEPEVSHNVWVPIKDRLEGNYTFDAQESVLLADASESLLDIEREGELNMIVTISGLGDTREEVIMQEEEEQLQKRFALSNTLADLSDVGYLTVRVIRAEGINPEYVWKRNPFTVLQVGNSRVQTKEHMGTVTPHWNKTFQFDIKDVYEVLEVTVYDDNGDYNYEFLGKIQIPLLNIESGVERWYRLKDKNLRQSAKGEAPRILLEMRFHFNSLRASSCVFKAKNIKYEENWTSRFEYAKFKLNARRVKKIKENLNLQKQKIINIFEWEDPLISFCALIIMSSVIWNFDSWMIPFSLVLVLSLQIAQPLQNSSTSLTSFTSVDDEDAAEDNADTTDNVDGGMMDALERIQQRALWMQEGMGELASAVESLENVFNFTVPFISWFIYIFLLACTCLLWLIPLRVVVLVWLLNRFRKGLMRHSRTSNKLMNFLSRVPDNEELKSYQELQGPRVEVRSSSLLRLRRRATKDSNII